MLVASHPSRYEFLVIVVKIYTKADFKVSWYCPILLDLFTNFLLLSEVTSTALPDSSAFWYYKRSLPAQKYTLPGIISY